MYGTAFFFVALSNNVTLLFDYIFDAGVNPELFGVILLAAGLTTLAGYLFNHRRAIFWGSTAQELIWLFTGLIAIITGNWFLSITACFFWVAIISICEYGHRPLRSVIS